MTEKTCDDYKAKDIASCLDMAEFLRPDDEKFLNRVKDARINYLEQRDKQTLSVIEGKNSDFLNDFFPSIICCPRQYMLSVTGNICHEPHRTVNREIDSILVAFGNFNEEQRLLTFNVAYGCCVYLMHLRKPEVKLQCSIIDQVYWSVYHFFNHDTEMVRSFESVMYNEHVQAYYPIQELLAIFGTIYWLLDVQKYKSEKIKLCLAWLKNQFCKTLSNWSSWDKLLTTKQKLEIIKSTNIFYKLVNEPRKQKHELTFYPWSGGRSYEDLKKFSLWRVTDFLEEDATLLLIKMCEPKSQKRLIADLEDILRKEFCNERKRSYNQVGCIATEKRLWKSYGDKNVSKEELNVSSEEEIDALAKKHLHFPDYWHQLAGSLKPVAYGLIDEEEEARRKSIKQNDEELLAFCENAQAELDAQWPNPIRKNDQWEYTIDSPEIQEYANTLTNLQLEILRQLNENKGEIKEWESNKILNSYTAKEIWEAVCPLYSECLILAFIEWGKVSSLKMGDKGKLVLRKYNESLVQMCEQNSTEEVVALQSQVDDLKKRVADYEQILHAQIPAEYESSIKSVFLPSYRLYNQDHPTYPQVREIGKFNLDPYEPTMVPIFIKACITMKCARKSAMKHPSKIVDALIGLGALQIEENNKKNFCDSVGRKIKRLETTSFTAGEQVYHDSFIEELKRPIDLTTID